MPIQQGVKNWQVTPLYDTYQLAGSTAAPTKIVFFETPAGATKGKNLSNLRRGFQLINGESMKVLSMRFVAIGCSIADVIALQKNYAASLIVSNITLLEAPMEFWAGGAGAVITAAGGSTGTAEYALNGAADPRAVASVSVEPITIEDGETFSVELNGTTFTSAAAVFLRCYLDGVYGKVVG